MRGKQVDNPRYIAKIYVPNTHFSTGGLSPFQINTNTASLHITPLLLSGPNSWHQDHPLLAALKELSGSNIHGEPQTLAHRPQSLTLLVVWSDNPNLFCSNAKRQQFVQIILHNIDLINILPRWGILLPRLPTVAMVEYHWMLGARTINWATRPWLHVVAACRAAALQHISVDQFVVNFQDGRVGPVGVQECKDSGVIHRDLADNSLHQWHLQAVVNGNRWADDRAQLIEIASQT